VLRTDDELNATDVLEETRTVLYELVREVFAADHLPMLTVPIETVTTVHRERRASLSLSVGAVGALRFESRFRLLEGAEPRLGN
jgi:hypothetical protein